MPIFPPLFVRFHITCHRPTGAARGSGSVNPAFRRIRKRPGDQLACESPRDLRNGSSCLRWKDVELVKINDSTGRSVSSSRCGFQAWRMLEIAIRLAWFGFYASGISALRSISPCATPGMQSPPYVRTKCISISRNEGDE
jgi:hypothetical protein